jgi:hypothetical protein
VRFIYMGIPLVFALLILKSNVAFRDGMVLRNRTGMPSDRMNDGYAALAHSYH